LAGIQRKVFLLYPLLDVSATVVLIAIARLQTNPAVADFKGFLRIF
jgi:hypothetical protein